MFASDAWKGWPITGAPLLVPCGTRRPPSNVRSSIAHNNIQCKSVFVVTLKGSWVLWQSLLPGDLTGDQLSGPQHLH